MKLQSSVTACIETSESIAVARVTCLRARLPYLESSGDGNATSKVRYIIPKFFNNHQPCTEAAKPHAEEWSVLSDAFLDMCAGRINANAVVRQAGHQTTANVLALQARVCPKQPWQSLHSET